VIKYKLLDLTLDVIKYKLLGKIHKILKD